MSHLWQRPRRPARSGFALPLVLLALVAAALLASALLFTSTTELVLSGAHRDATEDLYLAEGAIHAWIAEHADGLAPGVVDAWTAPGATVPVRIEVERLARLPPGEPDSSSTAVFAVHAEPARGRGGRAVVALIRTRQRHLPDLELSLDAAIVAGGDSRIVGTGPGDHRVFDGSDSPLCVEEGSPADAAVLHAVDAELQLLGAQLQGSAQQSGLDAPALIRSTLTGAALRDLAWNAERRFGRYFNEPPFPAGARVVSGHPDPRYDWGCPAEVVDMVRSAAPGHGAPVPCEAAADTGRHVLVAIDAENDTVVLAGEHAQGMLIVLNGDLHLTGSFVFQGLILAEGEVTLSGAGSHWPPSVDGSVVASRGIVIDRARTPPELGSGGIRSVGFNRCAVERTRAAFNARNGGEWGVPRVLGRPHAWFEVVR